ncbi:MAG TPA: TPM domain-containing protein [Arenimonas sp.]|uniref:TPM domain-containing protein n=1 Tax=Arenimonas sp. TaxID=1872635 RepID=UPI002CD388C1|nr:TPM domain-containing protein [Arenimonas sp.]HMB56093.1 TPM domain-containing protein [Arenimonas sp.]
MLQRLVLNLFGGWFRQPRWFPAATMRRIRDAIAAGELRHAGELCFAVESRYSFWSVLAGLQPRQRAQQVFSLLRVWDTQDNSGVLLYLQLAERRVELVADRGIAARVDAQAWQTICARFADDVRDGEAETAVLACLDRINALLTEHFPAAADNPRELPDEPVIL